MSHYFQALRSWKMQLSFFLTVKKALKIKLTSQNLLIFPVKHQNSYSLRKPQFWLPHKNVTICYIYRFQIKRTIKCNFLIKSNGTFLLILTVFNIGAITFAVKRKALNVMVHYKFSEKRNPLL